MDEMGLPRFQASDLEQGSMRIVLECLLTLKAESMSNNGEHNSSIVISSKSGVVSSRRWEVLGENLGCGDVSSREEFSRTKTSPSTGERQNTGSDSKFRRALRSPVMAEPSTALIHHVGHKFHEVFQLKQGSYTELPAAKISEMMKSNSLDIAPTQSLLSVVNGILDESVERKNGEIPQRVACLMRKVVQEIERRITTQAEHLRTQNDLYKTREEKYQSRIRVLEALATGTSEETKTDKYKMEEKNREEQDVAKVKEKDDQIAASKQELEIAKKSYELKEQDDHNREIAALKKELERAKKSYELKAKDEYNQEIAALKQELERANKSYKLKEKDEHKEIAALKQELEIVKKSYELKEKDDHNQDIAALKQELEKVKKSYELKEKDDHRQEIAALKQELEISKKSYELKQKDDHDQEIAALKQELEIVKKSYESKEKENHRQEIAALKQELEIAKKSYELKQKDDHDLEIEALKQELETVKKSYESKEKENHRQEFAALKQELETAKKSYEQHSLEMEKTAREAQQELEERMKEAMNLLTESKNRIEELETVYQTKSQNWNKKEHMYQIFIEFQLGAVHELRFSSRSIRQEVVKTQRSYAEEFNQLGAKVKALGHAAANYSAVLAENRKLHNEVQELKGNIRVYCRIRPFLRGQKEKQSVVEYIGENGELIVVNPSKQGKEGRRSFKFNKVFSPPATQAEVYSDIQALIQSVLDGFNVCIFAYGQTGSGKTYTMTGPDRAAEEDWGVNYRALNDLFRISQMRKSAFRYEITVQMMEIYNEQVRDLLSSEISQKRLEILSATQPNGLAVPDATMRPVNRTSDVLDLMNIGLRNRAKGSTALNERSSRSHSVVTIHVHGVDLKSGSSMRSSLHLVDLAGSERVDRSEVTGDRLKEAQHINKSLSALGDVISALAQKNAHIPYRNSKLTQLLQTSLGGQAKTLMFVQLNPEVASYSETMSTLKFAERASGVELGAARSSKEGRDVRDLMEQVVSLKDTISQKEEEIEKLQLSKDSKSVYTGTNS